MSKGNLVTTTPTQHSQLAAMEISKLQYHPRPRDLAWFCLAWLLRISLQLRPGDQNLYGPLRQVNCCPQLPWPSLRPVRSDRQTLTIQDQNPDFHPARLAQKMWSANLILRQLSRFRAYHWAAIGHCLRPLPLQYQTSSHRQLRRLRRKQRVSCGSSSLDCFAVPLLSSAFSPASGGVCLDTTTGRVLCKLFTELLFSDVFVKWLSW